MADDGRLSAARRSGHGNLSPVAAKYHAFDVVSNILRQLVKTHVGEPRHVGRLHDSRQGQRVHQRVAQIQFGRDGRTAARHGIRCLPNQPLGVEPQGTGRWSRLIGGDKQA